MVPDIQAARRAKLNKWLADNGGHAKVVRDFSLTPSLASALSQICNGYSFAERAARSWEERLRLPRGYFDSAESPAADLDELLERLGIALAQVHEADREAVAQNLAGFARQGGTGVYRKALLAMLGPSAPSGKRRRAA